MNEHQVQALCLIAFGIACLICAGVAHFHLRHDRRDAQRRADMHAQAVERLRRIM